MKKRSSAIVPVVILSLLLAGQILTSAQAGPPTIPPPSSHMITSLGPISVPGDSICRWEFRPYWDGTRIILRWVWICDYEQEPYDGDLPFGP
jgi:hypothetical protein